MNKNHLKKYWYLYVLAILLVALTVYYFIRRQKAKDLKNENTGSGGGAFGTGGGYTNIDADSDPLLKQGVSGEKVKALQVKLNTVAASLNAPNKPTEPGQPTGKIAVDGYFGNYTLAMLKYVSKNGPMGNEVSEILYSKINLLG